MKKSTNYRIYLEYECEVCWFMTEYESACFL